MKPFLQSMFATLFVASSTFSPVIAQEIPAFQLKKIATYQTGAFDEAAAEISAFDKTTNRLYVVNALANTLDILDLSNPSNPTKINTISFDGIVNSVAVYNGIVAAAVEAVVKQDAGKVVFLNSNGEEITTATVGALPDMVTFNNNGTQVITANEGEPNADYSVDPEGSVSVLDITIADGSVIVNTNTLVRFNEFNVGESRHTELGEGVRIFGPNTSVAQDLEPEYVALSANGAKAYVTLQENNALVII
ncbi:choice-of-anchor I domain-containing protein, partial [Nodularia spumigena]|uniref:choice-of-anchor I domain-containing protein n=1 Tax=Nodularia spumigena TaxID=70799 RepID=UPI002B393848|nr:alkaline phosphatase [Nodularia spumigena CH309]